MYSRMKRSAKKRGHNLPNFSKDEFIDWAYKNNFEKLYQDWVNSGFKKDKSPSVNRLDNYKSYVFNNLELVTWYENNQKGNIDRKNGTFKVNHKPVLQFDLDYNFIAEYVSINEASRINKINDYTITLVCKKIRKTAGGYIWKYKNDKN